MRGAREISDRDLTGGVVDAAGLRALGVSRSGLDRALRAGTLRRIRRGWFATPAAHPDIVRAVRAGGALSCVSALRLRGAWVLDRELHVRVARGDAVVRAPGVRLHWTDRRVGSTVIDDPVTALGFAVGCVPLREAVAVTDSVANGRLVPAWELETVLQRSPRGRRVLQSHDPTAESGLETFARLGLRSARLRVRTQVVIATVGRVDLLIGDRLVLELDGAEWHTGIGAVEHDRHRDRQLAALGYIVLRVTYRQMLEEWDVVLDQILRIVRRGDHRARSA
jgi:very-short-patch-repair endonuclease